MSEEEEFEVESLLAVRRVNGITEYLVKWKGYPRSEATWEPSENLEGCQIIVDEFNAKEKNLSRDRQSKRVTPYSTDTYISESSSDSSDHHIRVENNRKQQEHLYRQSLTPHGIYTNSEAPYEGITSIPSGSDTDDAENLIVYEQRVKSVTSSESFDLSDDILSPEAVAEIPVPQEASPVIEEEVDTQQDESSDFTLGESDDSPPPRDTRKYSKRGSIIPNYCELSDEVSSPSDCLSIPMMTPIYEEIDDMFCVEDSLEFLFSYECLQDQITIHFDDPATLSELESIIAVSKCELPQQRLAMARAMCRGLDNCLTEEVDNMLAELSAPTFNQFLAELTDSSIAFQTAEEWLANLVNEMNKVIGFIGRDSECSLCILTVLNDVIFNMKSLIDAPRSCVNMKQKMQLANSLIDNLPDNLDEMVKHIKQGKPVPKKRAQYDTYPYEITCL